MPYYTRDMVSYMKTQGNSSQAESVGASLGPGRASGVSATSAKSGAKSTSGSSKAVSRASRVSAVSRTSKAASSVSPGSSVVKSGSQQGGSSASSSTPSDDTYEDDDDGTYYSGMSNASSVNPSKSATSGSGVPVSSCAVSNNISVNANSKASQVSQKGTSSKQASRSASKSRQSKSRASSVKSQSKSNKPKRVLRVTPSCVDMDAAGAISRFDPEQMLQGMTFDDKRLTYMKNFLKLQVDRIQRMEGPIPASGKPYSKYKFDTTDPVMTGNDCTMYRVQHVEFPDVPMVAMMYERLAETVPNPFFLKILRHLGKKHPYILQTWEIFVDVSGRTLIVQEFANRNDIGTYLAKKGPQSEGQVAEWSRQLYKALDYLGDMGICHRNLKPRRVLLIHQELNIRLTGFYDSVIYWNVNKEDILNFPCIPVEKKSRDAPDFQAPEVHGNPAKEEFDPVSADVWSYGAILYFMISQNYPYNFREDNPKLEDEIQRNIKAMSTSEESKALLMSLLTTNAMLRLTFERIGSHPWFSLFRSKAVVSSVCAPR